MRTLTITALLVLTLLTIVHAQAEPKPKYWEVYVKYPDMTYHKMHVNSITVITESGEIQIKYDKIDEWGMYGTVLDLEDATITIKEEK